jgi:ABC-type uncharacterized transport system auxiliary subunit
LLRFRGQVCAGFALTLLWCTQRDICGAVALGLFVLAWGCSVRSREAIIYHALDYPSPGRELKAPIPQTLMIYRFLVDEAVDSDAIMLALRDDAKSPRRIHRWQENLADMITGLFLRDLEQSGMFEKVVDQLSNARYRYALEGTIRQLQVLRRTDKTFSLVEVEASFTDFAAPHGIKKDLLKKSYKVETPSRDASPEAVLEAFGIGIKDISGRLREDIRSALARPGAG